MHSLPKVNTTPYVPKTELSIYPVIQGESSDLNQSFDVTCTLRTPGKYYLKY